MILKITLGAKREHTFLVENMRHIYLGESLSNTARQTNLLSPPSQWSSLAAAAIVPLRQKPLASPTTTLYPPTFPLRHSFNYLHQRPSLPLYLPQTVFPAKKEKCREKRSIFFRSSMEADMHGKMVSDHHRAHKYGYFASIPNTHIPHLT